MDNLEDFLKGDEAPAAETETPETPEPVAEAQAPDAEAEAPKGPVRDEKGRFAPKGETPEQPDSASPAQQEPQLDHAALIGERRRRQEAEDRLRALEQQLQQFQQPQAAAPQGPPDRWEDPEGYDRWLVAQAAETARAEAFNTFQYQRIQMSAEEAKAKLPDYPEKIQVFEQMAQVNPVLMQEMMRAPNPAEYAYNTAKTHLEISQYGGIEGLIAARVQEALKTTPPAPTPVPDTLADAQSSRGSSEPYSPPTLDQILAR